MRRPCDQRQGLRMNGKDYLLQVGIIIGASSPAAGNGKIIVHLLESRKSNMSNNREILSRMIFSDTRMVFVKRHIQAPMQRILHTPMPSYSYGKLRYICQRGDIVVSFLSCPISRLDFGSHHAKTVKTRPLWI